MATFEECKQICDQTKDCMSFAYGDGSSYSNNGERCWYLDKTMNETEPIVTWPHSCCYHAYKSTCGKGRKEYSYNLINLQHFLNWLLLLFTKKRKSKRLYLVDVTKNECTYKRFNEMVEDEGNQILSKTIPLSACEDLCDETDGCESFRYCIRSNDCLLFDKTISPTASLQKTSNRCFTNYRYCGGGSNQGIKITGILIN